MPEDFTTDDQPSASRVILGVVIALVILGGLTYAAYLYSNRKSGLVFPAGYQPGQEQAPAKVLTIAQIDCSTTDPSVKTTNNYYIKCDYYKADTQTKWLTVQNNIRGVKFDFPEDLKLAGFANGYGFAWRTIAASSNLAVSFDLAEQRSGDYKTMRGEDYPKNYWKQYSGLAGIKSIVAYTTKRNISGWQAIYYYSGNDTPTSDTFFEDPTSPGDFIHFSKGILSDEVYKQVMDSFSWVVKSVPIVPRSPSAVPSLTPTY